MPGQSEAPGRHKQEGRGFWGSEPRSLCLRLSFRISNMWRRFIGPLRLTKQTGGMPLRRGVSPQEQ